MNNFKKGAHRLFLTGIECVFIRSIGKEMKNLKKKSRDWSSLLRAALHAALVFGSATILTWLICRIVLAVFDVIGLTEVLKYAFIDEESGLVDFTIPFIVLFALYGRILFSANKALTWLERHVKIVIKK